MGQIMDNVFVNVRVVGIRNALLRLKLMNLIMVFAAIIGGVREIDVDISYRD